MRKALIFILLGVAYCSCQEKNDSRPLIRVSAFFQATVDSLHNDLEMLVQHIETSDKSVVLQEDFKRARRQYKKIESLTEFYFPGIAKFINGPAIDKTEEYDDKVMIATGFQVVEENLFPRYDTATKADLLKEARVLSGSIVRLKQLVESNQLTDANVFEAVRLQLLRVASLGISGFDSPVALQSIPEARASLKGLATILSYYEDVTTDPTSYKNLRRHFEQASRYLETHTDFDAFDRAHFITRYVNRLSTSILEFQNVLQVSNNPWLAAIDMGRPTFFEEHTFHVDFFAPTYNREMKPVVPELGRLLFFDPILSGNNSRSCASCHKPSKAFSDGQVKSQAFNKTGEIKRNAPTLINSGFQRSQFWDQRVHFIEDQVTDVMANPHEMHGQIEQSSEKIMQSDEYVTLFKAAFGEENPVNKKNIQAALASYIRTLNGMNSPFDKYLRGDESVVGREEIAGFNLFMGKAKCGTCHFMPLFNGSVPPMYTETESEVIGVPEKSDTAAAGLDPDLGKYHTYNRELHKNAFKTPTIRNAALTAPYMHNGVFQTLEEVLDFYNRGGGTGIGIQLPNQTLPPDQLNLSRQEQQQIISFIHSLTDTAGLNGIPSRLPAFSHPWFADRKIGGAY